MRRVWEGFIAFVLFVWIWLWLCCILYQGGNISFNKMKTGSKKTFCVCCCQRLSPTIVRKQVVKKFQKDAQHAWIESDKIISRTNGHYSTSFMIWMPLVEILLFANIEKLIIIIIIIATAALLWTKTKVEHE